jgi:hypothetical protein
MAVNLSPVGGVAAQFFTSTGAVLTGGKLYTYAAGTTTPATAYTSSNGATAWTNPIVLNAAGRVSGGGEIWITDGILYKFVLTDANDVLIATYDNISGINSNFISFTNQQQIVTATAGQTVFNLSISYAPGTNSLSVFVDGVNQYGPGAQYAYTETDSDTVTFVSGLHVGAQVKFTTSQQQGAGAVNASQVTYNPAGTGAVATNVQAKLRQTVSVKDFGATGDGTTDDTAAIQAAINATVNGGMLLLPVGTYLVSDTLTFTANIVFQGQGEGSVILVASTMPITDPVLLMEPTTLVPAEAEFSKFAEFDISVQSGTPAGYAIHISAQYVNIAAMTIDRVRIARTGNTSIFADGANTASILTIQNCSIANGISIPNAGDTVRILNNGIGGTTAFGLDINFISGALLLLFMGNLCTAKFGIHIGAPALFSVISNNEFETFSTFVGSNNAFLDLDGSSTLGQVSDFVISQNSFNIVNGITANAIRVNYASGTSIINNRFFNGIVGVANTKSILLTANADKTFIGTNSWNNGGLFTDRVTNNGANTVIAAGFLGAFIIPSGNVAMGTAVATNSKLEVFSNSIYPAITAQSGSTTSGGTIVEFKNGTNSTGFKLTGDNKLQLPGYATGGANKTLQVDSAGNIVAV